MIAPVVITVFGSEVLRKGRYAGQPWFDQLGFAEGATPHCDKITHFPGLRFKIVAMLSHHPLGEGKNDAIEIEEVGYGIVILETIHSADRCPGELFFPVYFMGQHGFQCTEELFSGFGGDQWLVLRRHFLEVDYLNQFLNHLEILREVRKALNLQKVYFSFNFPILTMALDAMLLEDWFDNGGEGIGCVACVEPAEKQAD